MKMIVFEEVDKSFGERKVLRNLSAVCCGGQITSVVGPNGCGKSTLLHLIGGVDRPTSGKIFIDGNDITKMNSDTLAIFRRRQIGIVYQFYNLIPILNVEENITLPCELDGKTPDRNRVEEIMRLLGLSERKNHLPNELSGGQQQRVSIGRALMNSPAIILADEPTGNLDSKAGEEVISLLLDLNRRFEQTTIIITHDLNIARKADRIITIEDGRIK